MRFLFVLFFMLMAPASFAQDECVAGEATPEYSATTAGIKNYKFSKNAADNFTTETFQLSDGTNVKVTKGGCAHYDTAVTFSITSLDKSNKKLDAKFWLEMADKWLGKLPKSAMVQGSLQSELKEQRQGLLKAFHGNGANFKIDSTDGDGYDSVRLSAHEKGKITELSIGVNTAL